MSISNLISLLSGIALFLFGMSLMGDGLKKVAGNKLEELRRKSSVSGTDRHHLHNLYRRCAFSGDAVRWSSEATPCP